MKKRFLLASAAAAALGFSALAEHASGKFNHAIGLQLYSLRGMFDAQAKPGQEAEHLRKVEAGLQTAKDLGVKWVELAGTYGLPPERFAKMLKAYGLIAISEHVSLERLEKDVEGVAAEAKILGVRNVGVAWVPHEGLFDYKKAEETAEKFNTIGGALAKHGIHFFDHCHGYEFDPRGKSPEGLLAVDVLMRRTNPQYVCFEMDTFWVKYPGENPAAWLVKYPGRWQLMHIKDMKKGLETGKHTGGADNSNDVAAGTGQLNWPEILSVAEKEGVRLFFIEDESANPVPQIRESLRYLKGLDVEDYEVVHTRHAAAAHKDK